MHSTHNRLISLIVHIVVTRSLNNHAAVTFIRAVNASAAANFRELPFNNQVPEEPTYK
jgi:hypothetical protein